MKKLFVLVAGLALAIGASKIVFSQPMMGDASENTDAPMDNMMGNAAMGNMEDMMEDEGMMEDMNEDAGAMMDEAGNAMEEKGGGY